MALNRLTSSGRPGTFATVAIGSVDFTRTVALGTASTPFGHRGAQTSSTTKGAINVLQLTVTVDNATITRFTRGTGTGTTRMGA